MEALTFNTLTEHLIRIDGSSFGCASLETVGNKLVCLTGIGEGNFNTRNLIIYDLVKGEVLSNDFLELQQFIVGTSQIGNCAYFAAEGKMWSIDLNSFEKKEVWESNGPFCVSQGETDTLIMLEDGKLKIFEIKPEGYLELKDTIQCNLSPHISWQYSLTMSADQNFVAGKDRQENNRVDIVNLITKKTTSFEFRESPSGVHSPVVAKQVDETNITVLLGGGTALGVGPFESGCVYIVNVNLETGEYETVFTINTGICNAGMGRVDCLKLSNDMKYLFVGGSMPAKIFNMNTHEEVWTLPDDTGGGISNYGVFAQNSTSFLCAYASLGRGRLSLWSSSLSVRARRSLMPARIGSFTFSEGAYNSVRKNWMSLLPETTKVKKLVIPGTHDSGAIESEQAFKWLDVASPISRIAKIGAAQEWSVHKQLEKGIRFLDIRLVYHKEWFTDSKQLYVYHRDSTLLGARYQSFEDVLNEVYFFLDNNNSETVIMSLKSEQGEDISSDVKRYMEKHRSRWVQSPTENVTLKDAAGKVIAMDRAKLGPLALSWPKGNHLQDKYNEYDSDKKFELVKDAFKKSDNDSESGLCVNFLSANYNGLGIGAIASKVNAKVASYLYANEVSQVRGIMPMDFPTESLIFAMIKHSLKHM